jgi:RNA polymerase sigma-70 factor (ECF subfamily)
MLGSVADAKDVAWDAFLRWRRSSPETVDHPRSYLSKTVSRLCLDIARPRRQQTRHVFRE